MPLSRIETAENFATILNGITGNKQLFNHSDNGRKFCAINNGKLIDTTYPVFMKINEFVIENREALGKEDLERLNCVIKRKIVIVNQNQKGFIGFLRRLFTYITRQQQCLEHLERMIDLAVASIRPVIPPAADPETKKNPPPSPVSKITRSTASGPTTPVKHPGRIGPPTSPGVNTMKYSPIKQNPGGPPPPPPLAGKSSPAIKPPPPVKSPFGSPGIKKEQSFENEPEPLKSAIKLARYKGVPAEELQNEISEIKSYLEKLEKALAPVRSDLEKASTIKKDLEESEKKLHKYRLLRAGIATTLSLLKSADQGEAVKLTYIDTSSKKIDYTTTFYPETLRKAINRQRESSGKNKIPEIFSKEKMIQFLENLEIKNCDKIKRIDTKISEDRHSFAKITTSENNTIPFKSFQDALTKKERTITSLTNAIKNRLQEIESKEKPIEGQPKKGNTSSRPEKRQDIEGEETFDAMPHDVALLMRMNEDTFLKRHILR